MLSVIIDARVLSRTISNDEDIPAGLTLLLDRGPHGLGIALAPDDLADGGKIDGVEVVVACFLEIVDDEVEDFGLMEGAGDEDDGGTVVGVSFCFGVC